MHTVDVIYILSSGHSGSTLLDLLLGSHSEIEGVGEIRSLASYFDPDSTRPLDKQDCTCGRLVRECPYWAQVRGAVAKRIGTKSVALNPADPNAFTRENHALFEAILEVSGKRIICDSSKHYRRLAPMLHSPQYRIHAIHLLRDGRAVANSLKKRNRRFLHSVWIWQYNLLRALLLARLQRRVDFQVTRVRYEDLALQPEAVLRRILKKHALDFEPDQLAFSDGEHHNLSGNRMRMEKGQTIQFDTKYLDNLSRFEWIAGTLLCAPALLYFGYPLRRGAIADQSRGVP